MPRVAGESTLHPYRGRESCVLTRPYSFRWEGRAKSVSRGAKKAGRNERHELVDLGKHKE